MRRRRPSALYSVLDEEQLLDDVDLADHPDPDPGELWTEGERRRHDGWSPSRADGWGDWDPADVDGPLDWSPDGDGPTREQEPPLAVGHASPTIPGTRGPGRRRLALGILAALLLVLLVAREIGALLAGAGTASSPRPAATGATVGALSSMSRDSPSAGTAPPASPPAHLASNPRPAPIKARHHRAPAGSPHSGSDAHRPSPAVAAMQRPPGDPPASGAGSQATSGGPPPAGRGSRVAQGGPQAAGSRSPASQRDSAEQEFGFER